MNSETQTFMSLPVHNDQDNHHWEEIGNLDNDHKTDHWDHWDLLRSEDWHLGHFLRDTNNQEPSADCDHVGCKSRNI